MKAAQLASHDASEVPYGSIKSFAAGAISGAIAKTAVSPLDRTKILMQVSQMYGWERYRGSVWNSMRTIWRTEGFFGFFRGNSATVARIMPYAAVQYSAFEFYHRILSQHILKSEEPRPWERFIAGAMAGSTSVLLTYPIDLARTVLAVQVTNEGTVRPVKRLGVVATLYSISVDQGVGALYRGIYPTLVGVIPYAGISFLSFGMLKRVADARGIAERIPVFTSLVCGGSAGLIAQCCTYPFDLVRRRLQALHRPDLMTHQEKGADLSPPHDSFTMDWFELLTYGHMNSAERHFLRPQQTGLALSTSRLAALLCSSSEMREYVVCIEVCS